MIWFIVGGQWVTNSGRRDPIYEHIGRSSCDGRGMKAIMICPNITYFGGILTQNNSSLLSLIVRNRILYHKCSNRDHKQTFGEKSENLGLHLSGMTRAMGKGRRFD